MSDRAPTNRCALTGSLTRCPRCYSTRAFPGLSPAARERVLTEAEGNPLALRELAAELTAEADRVAVPLGAPGLLSLVQYARGTLELGYGQHAEAYEHLRRIHKPGDAARHYLNTNQMIGDFTEAAVRSGHRAEAANCRRSAGPSPV